MVALNEIKYTLYFQAIYLEEIDWTVITTRLFNLIYSRNKKKTRHALLQER